MEGGWEERRKREQGREGGRNEKEKKIICSITLQEECEGRKREKEGKRGKKGREKVGNT